MVKKIGFFDYVYIIVGLFFLLMIIAYPVFGHFKSFYYIVSSILLAIIGAFTLNIRKRILHKQPLDIRKDSVGRNLLNLIFTTYMLYKWGLDYMDTPIFGYVLILHLILYLHIIFNFLFGKEMKEEESIT